MDKSLVLIVLARSNRNGRWDLVTLSIEVDFFEIVLARAELDRPWNDESVCSPLFVRITCPLTFCWSRGQRRWRKVEADENQEEKNPCEPCQESFRKLGAVVN